MEKNVKAILSYLSKFKDAKGNEPDVIKVAFLIEEYCNLYVEQLNKAKS